MKNIVTKWEKCCQAKGGTGGPLRLVRRRDLVLVVFLLVLGGGLFVWRSCRETGEEKSVRILVDGEELGVWPLAENAEIPVEQENGDCNRLVIRDGAVFMQEANCPDGLCVQQGTITAAGDSIICLPHGLVAEIIGVRPQGEPDAIAR